MLSAMSLRWKPHDAAECSTSSDHSLDFRHGYQLGASFRNRSSRNSIIRTVVYTARMLGRLFIRWSSLSRIPSSRISSRLSIVNLCISTEQIFRASFLDSV